MNRVPALPELYRIRQHFLSPEVPDVRAAVSSEIKKLELHKTIKPGQTVALTAGSRGIKFIDTITRQVIDELKLIGAVPFIVPAMGSHGGATAEGQKALLSRYGITEETMGCEIRSSMETVVIGETTLGTKVYLDRFASEADHIGIINRVKPHTKLSGTIESGLLKMCLIGLGKREGARTYHRAADTHSWMEIVNSVSDMFIEKAPVAFGLAILQNPLETIGKIQAIKPGDFSSREPELLKEAAGMMASLPFSDADILIVDEMGKEISGTGMDTNITGRKEGSTLKITRVFVRDLTALTKGNAQGIGLADFTTRRLVDKIDFNALYVNALTAYRTDSCKVPMTFENDSDALRTAMEMAGIENPAEYRIMWIKNTLELEELIISEAYLERLKDNKYVEIIEGPFTPVFDKEGNFRF